MSRLQYRVEPARRRNLSKTDYSFKTKILLKINNNNKKEIIKHPKQQPEQQASSAHGRATKAALLTALDYSSGKLRAGRLLENEFAPWCNWSLLCLALSAGETASPAAAGHALLHPGMVSDSGEGWSEQLRILSSQAGGALLTAKMRGDMHGGGAENLFFLWFWAGCVIIFVASRSKLHLFSWMWILFSFAT